MEKTMRFIADIPRPDNKKAGPLLTLPFLP
jgi:hypothetical protein